MPRFIKDYSVPMHDSQMVWNFINKYWTEKGFHCDSYEGCEVWCMQCPRSPIMRYFAFSYSAGVLHAEAWTREAFPSGSVSDEQSLELFDTAGHRQRFKSDIDSLALLINRPQALPQDGAQLYGGFGKTQGGWYYEDDLKPANERISQNGGVSRSEYYCGNAQPEYAEPQESYPKVNLRKAGDAQLYAPENAQYGAPVPPNQSYNAQYGAPIPQSSADDSVSKGFIFALVSLLLPCGSFLSIALAILSLIMLCCGDASKQKSGKKTAGTVIAIIAIVTRIILLLITFFML